MDYIVLDLEWNQAAYKIDEEPDLPFEIIEIGAVKLNEKREIVDEFQTLIRPQVYPYLLRRTKEITGWTDDDLDERGIYFEDACEQFLNWCGKDYIFVEWGTTDLTQFERNMAYYRLPLPWKYPLRYLDAQKLFALQHNEGKSRRTLESAVEFFALPSDRPFHHAVDDAFYTGQVLSRLDLTAYGDYYSIDYYFIPKNRCEEETFTFPTYSKFVSKSFNLREEVTKNGRVRELRCRICGRRIKTVIPWFSDGRTYLCIGNCKEHGLMRGRIRIKMAERCEGYFAVKTFKTCTEDDRRAIEEKRAAVQEKRREKRKTQRKNQAMKKRAAAAKATGKRKMPFGGKAANAEQNITNNGMKMPKAGKHRKAGIAYKRGKGENDA